MSIQGINLQMNTIYKPYINFVYNIAEILPKLESNSNQSTCHAKQYRLLPAYNGLFFTEKKKVQWPLIIFLVKFQIEWVKTWPYGKKNF
jgi:hypothetical protein